MVIKIVQNFKTVWNSLNVSFFKWAKESGVGFFIMLWQEHSTTLSQRIARNTHWAQLWFAKKSPTGMYRMCKLKKKFEDFSRISFFQEHSTTPSHKVHPLNVSDCKIMHLFQSNKSFYTPHLPLWFAKKHPLGRVLCTLQIKEEARKLGRFEIWNYQFGEPHACPPQDWPHGGQSWGGQLWVHGSSGLPTSTSMFFGDTIQALGKFWGRGQCFSSWQQQFVDKNKNLNS